MLKKSISVVLSAAVALGTFVYIPALSGVNDTAIVSEAASSDFKLKKDSSGRTYVAGYSGKAENITIPSKAEYIGKNAFKNNFKIKSVTIPETCKLGIEKGAFENCVNLKYVEISGSVDHIEENAFSNCLALKRVYFDKANCDIKYIGVCAFYNCFALTDIIIPSGTKEIREAAFANCLALEYITVPESVKKIEDNAFGYMFDSSKFKYYEANPNKKRYISYFELYDNELIEWYSEHSQKALTMAVAKGSAADVYVRDNELDSVKVSSIKSPQVKATADSNKITLQWNALQDIDAYRVELFNEATGAFEKYKIANSNNSNKCTINNLESNHNYKIRVIPIIRNEKSYFDVFSSDIISAKTNKAKSSANNKESATEIIVKAEAGTDSISLSWNKVKNADMYEVYRKNNDSGEYEKYMQVSDNSCVANRLSKNTLYKFYVVAYDKQSEQYVKLLQSDVVSAKTGGKTTADADEEPDEIKLTAEADTNSISLSWTRVNKAEKYYVYLYNSKTKKYEKYKQLTTAAKSCVISSLESGKKYKVYVSAVKKEDGSYVEIVKSDAVEITTTTKKASEPTTTEAPVELKLTATAETDSISLSWNRVQKAEKYNIYIYNTKTKKYEKYKQLGLAAKSHVMSSLDSGKKYKIYVSAVKKEDGSYVEIVRSNVVEISTL